ncbi:MAG: transposase [Candidatus Oleimicrobiaceae bacterium]
MPYDPHRHPRRSIRLNRYDYTQPGAYFITVVTHEQACLFGEAVDGRMRLDQYGEIVREEWLQTAILRPRVIVDQFIVMPNHIHGIIMLTDDHGGATFQRAPTVERFGTPTSDSIPTIVRLFKSATTIRINTHRSTPGAPVWQRNYYGHIIRNENAAERIREYTVLNSLRWALDRENPTAASLDDFDRWLDAQGHIPIPGVTR